MAYSPGAFDALLHWLRTILPYGGSMLELGCQEINEDVPAEAIAAAMSIIHARTIEPAEAVKATYAEDGRMYTYRMFLGSAYHFRYVDLYQRSEQAIVCDLNHYEVSGEHRGRFDLVTNFGTTEHILNQLNAMRCIHDFMRPGGRTFHSVPCGGYYNHGLFNYQPIFFMFLADANRYEIEYFLLNAPHLRYSIPWSAAVAGTEHWRDIKIDSAIINCQLRRLDGEPFRIFTDFDRHYVDDGKPIAPYLQEVLAWRYDLRERKRWDHLRERKRWLWLKWQLMRSRLRVRTRLRAMRKRRIDAVPPSKRDVD
jgi:SAM-dependent methyltransferase